MGKSLKGLSFGVNGVVKDAKALINAKGAGKIIPGLNIAECCGGCARNQ